MEKGALIGEGRTAEIFAWGEDKVLKLFREGWSTGTAEHEAKIARLVQETGVNTPFLSEVLEIEGRAGLIYQRIDGPTMLFSLSHSPVKVRYFARKLAELQVAIHARTATGLPSQREKLHYAIANAPNLSSIGKKRLQAQLDTMPDGTSICHGDFHPDNILLSAHGPVIIDWTNASQGNPLADMAHSYMVMSFGPIPPGTPSVQKAVISIFRRLMVSSYRRHYLNFHPDTKGELPHWFALAAAARLAERIPGEEKGLMRVVEKYLRTK
jgi:tRNA A-37 threonylcarbamoyl transferase component Bud32